MPSLSIIGEKFYFEALYLFIFLWWSSKKKIGLHWPRVAFYHIKLFIGKFFEKLFVEGYVESLQRHMVDSFLFDRP